MILIADDDEVMRFLLTKQLEKFGLRSLAVKDGGAALKEFRTNRYDMIFMDVQMPVLDGLTATREIRKAEKEMHKTRIPIIAVTAIPNIVDCFDAGVDDYLRKPVSLEGLRRVVQHFNLVDLD